MRKYYVHYYRDFGNTYNLYWTDGLESEAALPDGAERISRKRAFELARRERDARKYDPAFSGYADSYIYSPLYSAEAHEFYGQPFYVTDGYIVELF